MERLRLGPASPRRAWPLLVIGLLVGSLALTPAVSFAAKVLTKKKAVKLFEKKKHAAAQYADAATREVRVASAGDPDDAFSGGGPGGQDGTILTTQISAPGPGFLVVDASSDVTSTTTDSSSCGIRVNGATIPSSVRNMLVDPAQDQMDVCATHATQPVGAGGHTVEFRAFAVGAGAGGGTYGPASMNVLFVALGAGGGLGV